MGARAGAAPPPPRRVPLQAAGVHVRLRGDADGSRPPAGPRAGGRVRGVGKKERPAPAALAVRAGRRRAGRGGMTAHPAPALLCGWHVRYVGTDGAGRRAGAGGHGGEQGDFSPTLSLKSKSLTLRYIQ